MLLEFKCSNHRSVRDEVLFSLLASSDTTNEEEVIRTSDGTRVLKSAVIYGANGSGKSNLVDAFSFVKNLVSLSIRNQPGEGIPQSPHKKDGYDRESSYRMQFITKGVRYAYGFTLRNMLVCDEYLYYFPSGRQTRIFEREGETFSPGSRFRGRFSACRNVLKPNRLFLSCAANFSTVEEVVDAYNFFSGELVVYSPENQESWMKYSLYQMNSNPATKASVLKFLSELDTGIKDIRVEIDRTKLSSSDIPPFLSDDFKVELLRRDFDAVSAKVVYDEFETDLMTEESGGVRKLFGLLCPLIDIMVNGKVLVCDELESGLHESLLYGLVKLFSETESGKPAQMIFTTHETGLLSLDLFRRDQIWFTELRKSDRSTDLYSLAEIKNVRKEDNFMRGYMQGRYGAVPNPVLDFSSIINEGR